MKSMRRLYYSEPYRTELETHIVQYLIDDDILWVAVEETIIYPGGGGQAMDKASLNELPVKQIKESGNALFYGVDLSLKPAVGDPVTMRIDPVFRLYNMQQHSGQHLMSAVFAEMDYPTVSAHLGEFYTAIEINGGEPSSEELDQFEARCNQAIRAALPIKIYLADKKKAGTLPLRKPAGNINPLRIVQIGELDYSACAGTHVANSSEIGLIKIFGTEKIRGHVRIKVRIGQAAMTYIDQLQNTVTALQQKLAAPPESLLAALQKHLDEKTALMHANKNLRRELSRVQASLLNSAHPKGIIAVRIDSVGDAQQLCRVLTQTYHRDALLLTSDRFFFARCAVSNFDFKTFLQNKGALFGLRGGGGPDFMQGVYKTETGDDLLQAVRQA